jgi:murein tripeptide amidase MpaA
VFSWTTEFWSPQRRAGIEDYQFIEWLRDHSPEDDLKLLQWADRDLDGKGYVEWYPYEHEQLGSVELGGWDIAACWANVPFKFLQSEIAPHSDWAVWHLLVSPRLEVRSLDVEALGDGRHLVRVVLENTGWLPTYVSQRALDRKAVRPIEVELMLPDGARVVAGDTKTDAGELEGRVHLRSALWWGTDQGTSDRTKLEWVVEAPQGGTLGVEARHQRAGVVRQSVELSTNS